MIFKIPSRTVPEYHLGAAGTVSLNSSVLLYSMSQQAELSECFSTPLLPDSIVWESKNCPLHYTCIDSAEADLLPLILGQNKSTSNLRERNPYSTPP